MICAVTTFASSIYNYAYENAVYVDGNWHGSAEDVDLKTYELIKNESKIEDYVYAQQLGYAKVDGCTNENKPYLFVGTHCNSSVCQQKGVLLWQKDLSEKR